MHARLVKEPAEPLSHGELFLSKETFQPEYPHIRRHHPCNASHILYYSYKNVDIWKALHLAFQGGDFTAPGVEGAVTARVTEGEANFLRSRSLRTRSRVRLRVLARTGSVSPHFCAMCFASVSVILSQCSAKGHSAQVWFS